jgi:hypothetical protein
MAQASVYSRSYNSFSGVDIKATFGGKVIGELQAISFSVTREKAPIYTMGSAEMRSVSRGKRGIAGTMIFVIFDRSPLISGLSDLQFQSDTDDVWPEYTLDQATSQSLGINLHGNTTSTIGGAPSATQQESEITTVASDQQAARPWYVDQIPAFDVVLAAANEYGALAVMHILGCEILNQGYGVSIDDVVSEEQYTYIARAVKPWSWVKPVFELTPGTLS